MNARKTLLSSLISLFFLSGCAIRPLGYFHLDPYAKPFTSGIDRPLNVVLLSDVKDDLVVQGVGVKDMSVTDFRKSFGGSMKYLLGKNFTTVNFISSKPDTGLTLVIYRVKPFWRLNSQSSNAFGTGGDTYSTTTSLVSAAFQFETSLFLGNEKIKSADDIVYSDDQMAAIRHAHSVFQSGLLKTCETINRKIFDDEVIDKIMSADIE